ncbi:MAG: NnrU family protein [Planctomycetota bacterium]
MKRFFILAYGLSAYVFTLWTILYLTGFVTGIVVPRTIDEAPLQSGPWAWGINIGLIGIFAVQHMIMAREGFKVRLRKLIPAAAERSTFVLITCLILNLIFLQWRAMPYVVWSIDSPTLTWCLRALSLSGWGLVLLATFLINHFELFGVEQVWKNFRNSKPVAKRFMTPSLYRLTRHPMYLGFFIAFWTTPSMSLGHLLFAGLFTAWVLFEIVMFEEPDLVKDFGIKYRRYQATVRMILPIPVRRDQNATVASECSGWSCEGSSQTMNTLD